MSLSETRRDSLALAIANSGTSERMVYFLPLMRLLADGAPVSSEQLAAAINRPAAEVIEALRQFEEIVYDEEGRIVGAGLSLLPTPYLFEINGHLLYTWCALDTLLFPVWLGRPAQVSSTCPVTGQPIHLRVSPERLESFEPGALVLSLLIQEELATCCNIRDAFCAYSQFFASQQAASAWQVSHSDGHLLPIEEAFTLGQTLARLTMQRLQEER